MSVECGCSCSGCGGFSYSDIVNKKYADKWYEKHNCERSYPRLCPMVCCPARTLTCNFFMCGVKEKDAKERDAKEEVIRESKIK